ncbi:MAG: hypothetical protein R6U28_03300 [Cyclonatronaceae bacterium]
MNSLLIYPEGAGSYRSLAGRVVLLALMLVFTLTPSFGRAMIDGEDPVMKRALDAGIDAERLGRLVVRAQNREMTPDQLRQILIPVISLAEMDLPYHVAMHKVAEGLAKQVPAPGILYVLEDMQNSMDRSVAIIDPWMGRTEVQGVLRMKRTSQTADEVTRYNRHMLLEGASFSLQNEADEMLLRRFLDEVISAKIMEKGDLRVIASGLQALSEMPMTQDDPGLSIRLLVGAMSAGFSASEVRELPRALRSTLSGNHFPLEKLTGHMDPQQYKKSPAMQIMEHSFQGNMVGGPPAFHLPDVHRDGESDRGRDRKPPVPPLP